MCLYDTLSNLRSLVYRCVDSGQKRKGENLQMVLSVAEYRGGRMATSCCGEVNDDCLSCCRSYRFSSVLSKIVEIASLSRSLGASLLIAFEKGDSEYLTVLRDTHERHLLDLGLESW